MILVSSHGKSFLVKIDRKSNTYRHEYAIIRSLLCVTEVEPDTFMLNYDDFVTFKNKLDLSGNTEERFMDQNASNLFDYYLQWEGFNMNVKNGLLNDSLKDILSGKLKTQPYEDQWTGISYLYYNNFSGNFDTMGIGKTLQALAAFTAKFGDFCRILVIAPASVLLDFSKEITKHTYLKSLVIPSGRKNAVDFLKKNVNKDWNFLLVNPENLISSSKSEIIGDLTKHLSKLPFNGIIIDEFHLYKNLSAKRTSAIIYLAQSIRNADNEPVPRILMTGTPVSESPTNAYVALKILGDTALPPVLQFENFFTVKKKININYIDKRLKRKMTREVDKVVGFKNLDQLRDKMNRLSIRRTKDDLKGFPDKTIVTRSIMMGAKQKAIYNKIKNDLKAILEEKVNIAELLQKNPHAVRLRQVLNHPRIIDEDADSCKYDEIEYLLEEILSDPTQKVIIWTSYRKAVDLIYDTWNEKYGVMKIYGGVDIDQKMADTFNYDPSVRVAACIPAKAGTGVDFLARARTAIYIDRPDSYTLYMQSMDRIHRRVGGDLTNELDRIRSKTATLIFLDVVGSVDELVKDRLADKSDMVDAVTDVKKAMITKKELLERYL